MSFLASVLIGVAGRRAAARFETATLDPVGAQQRKLLEILTANRDTEYGRAHGFSKIQDLAGYQRSVPVVTYEDLRGHVDRMARGDQNVLTAEAPVMFAMTSGTTGNHKLIPVTPTCRGRDHADQIRVWLHHARLAHPGILRGKKVHPDVRCIILPGTQDVCLEAIADGTMQTLIEAGCAFSTPTCGACLGGHMGVLAEGERAVATTNRNFVGRMGHPGAEVYLASPYVAAASALAGHIATPEEVGAVKGGSR
jgi:hypothetical protein